MLQSRNWNKYFWYGVGFGGTFTTIGMLYYKSFSDQQIIISNSNTCTINILTLTTNFTIDVLRFVFYINIYALRMALYPLTLLNTFE